MSAMAASAEDLNKDPSKPWPPVQNQSGGRDHFQEGARRAGLPQNRQAGLVFGGSYGEGVLMKNGAVSEYYNSVSASLGLASRAESYAYVVFLMSDKAVALPGQVQWLGVRRRPQLGAGQRSVAKNLSTSTLKDDAYAFITDQQGLMASLSIEGTKISRIKR